MAQIQVRATKREIARQVAVAKVAAGYGNYGVDLVAVGKASDPRWMGVVNFATTADTFEFDVADDSGKVKLFGTVDAAVKFIAGVNEDSMGVYDYLSIQTGDLYASSVPSDIYADAERKVTSLTRVMAAQQGKATALNALLTGVMATWATGNAAQQAKFTEVTVQHTAVVADVAALTAEIAKQQAIVDSKP